MPLLLVLILVEFVDLVFAADSIPSYFCGHDRPIPCLHLERVCDSWPAFDVFPALRDRAQVCVFEIRPVGDHEPLWVSKCRRFLRAFPFCFRLL